MRKVTIWNTSTSSVAERDGVPLVHLTGSDWVRPKMAAEMRANPSAKLANFLPGERILDEVHVEPTLSDNEVRGALPSAPSSVDMEAGTATYTYPTAAKPVAARQAEMVTAVKARYAVIVAAGFTWRVDSNAAWHTYQIDDASQANMVAVQVRFDGGASNAHGGYWRDSSNVDVTLDDAGVQALFAAAYDYKMAAIRLVHALIAAITAAADHAALDLIDITAGTVNSAGGWPANGG